MDGKKYWVSFTEWKLPDVHPEICIGHKLRFQCRNEQFFARSRKSRNYAEVYEWYTAQVIPRIDAEIAEKGHFWMETTWWPCDPSFGSISRAAPRQGQ